MPFAQHQIPVAYSMVSFVERRGPAASAFEVFCCYWMAFNNIYSQVAAGAGVETKLRLDAAGRVLMEIVAGATIPKVRRAQEKAMLEEFIKALPDGTCDELIRHNSTKFFVDRTPKLNGNPIEHGPSGDILNGVLMVDACTDPRNPVWRPIDSIAHARFLAGPPTAVDRRALTEQIINVLYTVRNNTFHGGKQADDENALVVLQHALELVKLIVRSFLLAGAAN